MSTHEYDYWREYDRIEHERNRRAFYHEVDKILNDTSYYDNAGLSVGRRSIGSRTSIENYTRGNDPSNCLILPGRSHGNYSYPDLLVSKNRTCHDGSYHEITDFLWSESRAFILTCRQAVDFLNLLKSGRAYDGNGKLVSKGVLEDLYLYTTSVYTGCTGEYGYIGGAPRCLLSGEFLNCTVKSSADGNVVTSNRICNGELKEVTEPLEECLMENEQYIDREDWLRRANNQGLPPKDVKKGRDSFRWLFYDYPERYSQLGSVANLRAHRSCGENDLSDFGLSFMEWGPRGGHHHDGIGVRSARIL